ncbi:5-hydroxytryptamine receptor 3A-like [Mixophyes fleayi]|uniref:5-hydroxytryptamine receptor 3A-like n=1 Tax=Mixophyes fleayi TaxID=3061075 RepID=UPI003F4D93D9
MLDNFFRAEILVTYRLNPTLVHFQLFLRFGPSFPDMNQQTVVLYVWLSLSWQNDFISWNPDDFCGIKSLFIPSDYFWKPDVYVYEMTESDKIPVISYYKLNNDGKIEKSYPLRLVSTCHLDLFKFPFDTQVCRVTFGSYIYTVMDLIMVPKTNSSQVVKNSKEAFISKGDWKLINITVHNLTYGFLDKGFSQVIYEITIQREPILYIINLIVPACFMVFLDIASMLIQSYEERLNFKINVILGFSVLLLILNNIMPQSDTTPLLGIFCCVCMAMMVLSIIGNICSSYMLELSATLPHVPPWLKTLVLHYLAYILCFRRTFNKQELVADGAMHKGSEVEMKTFTKNKRKNPQKVKDSPEVKLLKMVLVEILKIHQELILAKNEEEAKSEWFKVVLVIDRLIIILYFLTVVGIVIILINVWSM